MDVYHFDDTTVDTDQSITCHRIQSVDGPIYFFKMIMLLRVYTLS